MIGAGRVLALFSRGSSKLGRQLTSWIAAYALVLHALLAGIVVTQTGVGTSLAGVAAFELCLTDHGGSPLPGQAQHQHDGCALHCAFAGGLALLAAALFALLRPQRLLALLGPLSNAPSFAVARRAGLSRAPPLQA
jgi:hypothetical protein